VKTAILVLLASASVAAADPTPKPSATPKPKDPGPRQECHTTREIKLAATREEVPGGYTYPVGTVVHVLKIDRNHVAAIVLIGPTREECIIGLNLIAETGGTPGPAMVVRSIQPPTAISIVNHDGPPGFIPTGIAAGDENLPGNPAWERRIFELTNAARVEHGLKPLMWDEDCAKAARYQAIDSYVQDYSHGDHSTSDQIVRNGKKDPGCIDQDDMTSRLRRFLGIKNGFAENSGRWAETPEKCMALWMRSPAHRANILEPRFTKLGVGVCLGVGGSSCVQVFRAD
jgi:uncharacterized protein YkwD